MELARNYQEVGQEEGFDTILAEFTVKVYGWMSFALFLTALTAWNVANSQLVLSFIYQNDFALPALILSEVALVWLISNAIDRLSSSAISFLFVFCALLNGIILSFVFSLFTVESVASAFIVSALTFGVMSLYGLCTKQDLTEWRSVFITGIVGLVIASVFNLFFSTTILSWIITYVGVILFAGLTAYDSYKLQKIGYQIHDERMIGRIAISGALTLYLDFVNLFLFILQILGHRR